MRGASRGFSIISVDFGYEIGFLWTAQDCLINLNFWTGLTGFTGYWCCLVSCQSCQSSLGKIRFLLSLILKCFQSPSLRPLLLCGEFTISQHTTLHALRLPPSILWLYCCPFRFTYTGCPSWSAPLALVVGVGRRFSINQSGLFWVDNFEFGWVWLPTEI